MLATPRSAGFRRPFRYVLLVAAATGGGDGAVVGQPSCRGQSGGIGRLGPLLVDDGDLLVDDARGLRPGPKTREILVVDSLAAAAGGAAGISSNTSYIESATGVGARTGLASVVTGIAFLLATFLTIILMPFTYSITVGIGAGFVSFVVIEIAVGKIREIHPLMAVTGVLFVVYFALEPIKTLLGV